MKTIGLQESVIKQKYNEMRDMDTRLDAFKQEFMQVLDERDFLDKAYTKIQSEHKSLDDDHRKLSQELTECFNVICSFGYRSFDSGDLVASLSQLKHDFKQKTDHNNELIQQLSNEKSDRQKEKSYLQEKLHAV